MRVLDLFCGAGGFGYGFKEAGYEIVKGVDNFWPAVETYKKNVGEAVQMDVKEFRGERGEAEVVIGSPPCEAYTAANARRREKPEDRLYKDPSGRLVLEFVRVVGEVEPEVYVMENVVGLLSVKKEIKKLFNEIGYKVKFNVLEAANYGVPSFRRRVFVSNVKIKPRKEGRRTVWDAIGDLPDPRGPHDIPNHVYRKLPKKVAKKVGRLRWGRGAVYFKGATGVFQNYVRLNPYQPAPTVMGKSRFIHPYEDRLLTVRENARLMGFPDHFVFYGGIETQYDLVGEAVPPPLARKIAEYIAEVVE